MVETGETEPTEQSRQPAQSPPPPDGPPDEPPPPPGPPGPRPSPVPVVLAAIAGVWTVTVAAGTQLVTWLIGELFEVAGLGQPGWIWPVAAWVGALLIGVPAMLLATVPRSMPVRWSGRAWLAAAVGLGVLGSVRAVPVLHHELYLTLVALLAAGLSVLVSRANRIGERARGATDAILLGVAAGLACLLPWAWLGALGGVLETVLAAVAAVAVAWLASAALPDRFWGAFAGIRSGDHREPGGIRFVVVGGLVAGVALAPLAAGTGAAGVFLGGLLVVPALGFAAAALQPMTQGRSGWPLRAMVALALFGPLAFIDSEETSLLLNLDARDAGYFGLRATGIALGVALLAGLAYGSGFVHRGRPLRPRRRHRTVAAATAVVLAAGVIIVYAGPGQPGTHGDRLFVIMKEQADLTGIGQLQERGERLRTTYQRLVAEADRTQAPLRRQLDRWGFGYTPYYLVNGLEVDGGPGVREWLSARSDVARVLISPRLRPLPQPLPVNHGDLAAPTAPQWNVTQIEADQVWTTLGVTGRGIVIGTSDSGVDSQHPTLRNGFRGGDDSWFDPWSHTRTPTDHNGHGTHTLGSAVGRAPDGSVPRRPPQDVPVPTAPAIGVAPGAEWMGCVNLERNLGNPAHYLDCMQFMLAPFPFGGDPLRDGRPERAPHILTNSWGCPAVEGCDLRSLQPATEALAAAGIFFVAAAGNTGPFCRSVSDPPAPYPDVLTVGAVDRTDAVADFSSRGPAAGGLAKPDIAAPGVAVLSALPGGTYGELDGTSMATPHVAGVVALMWSANPRLIGDIALTRRLLTETARPPLPTFGESGDDACGGAVNVRGAGVVDALAAVRAAQRAG